MNTMDLTEYEAILKEQGWTKRYRVRRKNSGLKYASAQRRRGGKLYEVHIAPLAKLGEWTREMLLQKLAEGQKKIDSARETIARGGDIRQ